jgi:hypothetical protein
MCDPGSPPSTPKAQPAYNSRALGDRIMRLSGGAKLLRSTKKKAVDVMTPRGRAVRLSLWLN